MQDQSVLRLITSGWVRHNKGYVYKCTSCKHYECKHNDSYFVFAEWVFEGFYVFFSPFEGAIELLKALVKLFNLVILVFQIYTSTICRFLYFRNFSLYSLQYLLVFSLNLLPLLHQHLCLSVEFAFVRIILLILVKRSNRLFSSRNKSWQAL